jgi:hypothetical protein
MSSPILCPVCSSRMNRLPTKAIARELMRWHCTKCRKTHEFLPQDFHVKSKAEIEEESANIESIISSLNRAKSESIDYVGLDPQLRDEAQKLFSLVLSKPLNDWKEIEAELYRACVDFPGRREYVGLQHHNNLHRIERSLSVLCKLSQAQLKALGGVGKTLGAVKVGTSFAGLNAARQLGESMGEDMGEFF